MSTYDAAAVEAYLTPLGDSYNEAKLNQLIAQRLPLPQKQSVSVYDFFAFKTIELQHCLQGRRT